MNGTDLTPETATDLIIGWLFPIIICIVLGGVIGGLIKGKNGIQYGIVIGGLIGVFLALIT